jgi:hypothetical protein
MRRVLLLAASALLLLALVPTHVAEAATVVAPRLTLTFNDTEPSTLTVAGRKCFPVADAPASVLVTADWVADKVFTAAPDATGQWSVEVPLPADLDGSYLVNAECDGYYGEMKYPESGFGVLAESSSAPVPVVVITDPGPPVANTGSQTGAEFGLGALLLGFGAALLWVGRRRGARGA